MKRREFVLYSILAGFGMFSAFSSFSNSTTDETDVYLPESENHIRHGSFNLDKVSGIEYPNGVSNLQFQRFYKNGFTESRDDLCVVTFHYNGKKQIVQFKFYELCDQGYIDCSSSSKNANFILRLL